MPYVPVSVDRVAVDRFCGGESVPLNRREKAAVVARLTSEGRSQRWIAERLEITRRSVCRLRRRALRDGRYA